jgi:predicted amidohydrolase YtcJ
MSIAMCAEFRQLAAGGLSATAILLAGCQQQAIDADIIFSNGVVYTANAAQDVHEVAVIDDGKIVAVGGGELLKRYTAPNMIDLNGRLLIPGFNDAHTHIDGNPRNFVEVSGARSVAELADLVKGMTSVVAPGQWITGYGWSEDRFSEGRKPTRADLDAVAPDNPVFLTREGGHAGIANSAALKIAGLTAATPQPTGGELEKDASGQLTGVIAERFELVTRHIPAGDPGEIAEDLARNLNSQLALGITSLTDASVGVGGYERLWKRVYSESALPLPRATTQINPGVSAGNPDAAIQRLRDFGAATGAGDNRLKVGALKIFIDGGFTGPAAYTTRGYRHDPSYHGSLTAPIADIEAVARAAHEMGWQFGFHTIGDAAIDETAAMIDRILTDMPKTDHRHYLNHFSMTPTRATMELMARDGIAIAQQPNFTHSLEGRYTKYLPDEALPLNNPVATPLMLGVKMGFSSDIIPIGPLVGIYAAVTRKGASGEIYGPDERIDIKQALRLYTYGGAWLNFDDDIKGTIEPGKLADLVVLNENLLAAPPERILEAKVDITVLDGKVAYERPVP